MQDNAVALQHGAPVWNVEQIAGNCHADAVEEAEVLGDAQIEFDEDTLISSVKKTNRCVVAHEAVTRMGFGAEVAAVIQYGAFDWLDAPIERVGAKFTPLPFAPVMEEWVVPHSNDVLQAIHATLGRDGN